MCAELELWRAVIMQAMYDLFSGTNLQRRAAFRWFFEKNQDFKNVCDLAGVDPMYLRQIVFWRIING